MKPQKKQRVRPYWHVDLKWLFGIVAVFSVAALLTVIGLFRLTERERAIQIVSVGIASAFSPEGLDEAASIAEIQGILEEQPDGELQLIQDIDVFVRAEDIEGLSPRQTRIYVFRQIAEPLYDQGVDGVTELSQDPAIQAALRNDVGMIALLSAGTHRVLGWVLAGLALLSLISVGLSLLWSSRFGRLVTPGIILLLTSLPGVLFATLLGSIALGGSRQANPASSAAFSFEAIFKEIGPLVTSALRPAYLIALILGLLLLVGALIGRLVVRSKKSVEKTPKLSRI